MTKVRVGALISILVGLSFGVYSNAVSYVDAQGFLHEPFFLIPLGWLLVFAGLITLIVSVVRGRFTRAKV